MDAKPQHSTSGVKHQVTYLLALSSECGVSSKLTVANCSGWEGVWYRASHTPRPALHAVIRCLSVASVQPLWCCHPPSPPRLLYPGVLHPAFRSPPSGVHTHPGCSSTLARVSAVAGAVQEGGWRLGVKSGTVVTFLLPLKWKPHEAAVGHALDWRVATARDEAARCSPLAWSSTDRMFTPKAVASMSFRPGEIKWCPVCADEFTIRERG